MARRLALLFAALLVAASLGACKSKPMDEIVIGEFGSLTGGTATFGRSTDEGIQLAVERSTPRGGVLGKKMQRRSSRTTRASRRGRHRGHEADQAGPGRRGPRRGRQLAQPGRGARLPAQRQCR